MRNLAVMANRIAEDDSDPMKGLDDFPTPPWGGAALCYMLGLQPGEGHSCWEPAANRGHLIEGLETGFDVVEGTDIFDYGVDPTIGVFDFLGPIDRTRVGQYDWIVTNPPFKKAEEFVHKAFEYAPVVGVAMFARLQFLEGQGRYERLFSKYPTLVMPFSERIALVKGRMDLNASTATAYAWFVFGLEGGLRIIPPGMKELV